MPNPITYIQYYTKDVADRLEMLQILIFHGYYWHRDPHYTPEQVEREYSRTHYNTLCVYLRSKELCGTSTYPENCLSKGEFLTTLDILVENRNNLGCIWTS